MNELYNAVNAMMARLGAEGTISSDAPEVNAVMGALHDIDGGALNCNEDDMINTFSYTHDL